MSSRNSKDLLIVMAFTILALGTILLQANGVVAWSLVALPLLLVLPGYALTAALFPATEAQRTQGKGSLGFPDTEAQRTQGKGSLGFPETLAYSVGLSLATVIVGGVILDMTSEGLTSLSWTIFLVSVTLGGCAIAAFSRRKRRAATARSSSLKLNVRQVFFFAASIVVVVYAIMIVRDESFQPSTPFTQLWAKPAALLGQTAFDIGVYNSESRSMEYKLEIKSGGTLVYESSAIALAPGETWEQVLTFQSLVNGDVQVFLYRLDDPGTIYRQVVSRSATP